MKQTILTFLLASLCLMAVAQSDNMLSTPLTIEAISDGVVTIDNPRSLTLQYSLNGYSKISVSEENIELYMNHPEKQLVLPATTLAVSCYARIFVPFYHSHFQHNSKKNRKRLRRFQTFEEGIPYL